MKHADCRVLLICSHYPISNFKIEGYITCGVYDYLTLKAQFVLPRLFLPSLFMTII